MTLPTKYLHSVRMCLMMMILCLLYRPVLEDSTLLVKELEFLKFEKSSKKKDVSKATDPSSMEVDVEDESELR